MLPERREETGVSVGNPSRWYALIASPYFMEEGGCPLSRGPGLPARDEENLLAMFASACHKHVELVFLRLGEANDPVRGDCVVWYRRRVDRIEFSERLLPLCLV